MDVLAKVWTSQIIDSLTWEKYLLFKLLIEWTAEVKQQGALHIQAHKAGDIYMLQAQNVKRNVEYSTGCLTTPATSWIQISDHRDAKPI